MDARNLVQVAAGRLSRRAVAAVLALAVALAVTGCGAQAEHLDTPSSASEVTRASSPRPSVTPGQPTLLPTETPAPVPVETADPTPVYPGSLKPGDWVEVTGAGCLNARTRPGLNSTYPEEDPDDSILNCLPDGFIGRLEPDGPYTAEQPVALDGYNWWYLVGQGWAVEEFLTFHHEGGAFWPPRPDLASSGLIAYIGAGNNVWLMNADGSDQRLLASGATDTSWITAPAWSPTGQQVSFSVETYVPTYSVTTRIVGLDGVVDGELPGFAHASWSPDGGRLAGIRMDPADPSGNVKGTPVVRDLSAAPRPRWAPPPSTGRIWSGHLTARGSRSSAPPSRSPMPDPTAR